MTFRDPRVQGSGPKYLSIQSAPKWAPMYSGTWGLQDGNGSIAPEKVYDYGVLQSRLDSISIEKESERERERERERAREREREVYLGLKLSTIWIIPSPNIKAPHPPEYQIVVCYRILGIFNIRGWGGGHIRGRGLRIIPRQPCTMAILLCKPCTCQSNSPCTHTHLKIPSAKSTCRASTARKHTHTNLQPKRQTLNPKILNPKP